MPERKARNDSLHRCFLLAPPGTVADAVAGALGDRGVECLRPEDLLQPGLLWSDELTRHLAAADFVVAVVPSSPSANVAFELGLAHGLRKPAVVIAAGNASVPAQLRGLTVVRVADLGQIAKAVPDIDRFLRHAKRISPTNDSTAQLPQRGALRHIRERSATVRGERGAARGFLLVDLVADIFRTTGAEIQLTEDEPQVDRGVDFVLWSDDLARELDGPILVECKAYTGSTGSVIKNAEHTLKLLEGVVRSSDARLALLVYDHDRPRDIPISDMPLALAFSVGHLIDTVESGNLAEEIFARRGRAAYVRGRSVAEPVQQMDTRRAGSCSSNQRAKAEGATA